MELEGREAAGAGDSRLIDAAGPPAVLTGCLLLMLTLHEDRAYPTQALQLGVRGHVLKRSAAENLIPALRAVLNGDLYVDPGIRSNIFSDGAPAG